MSNAIITVDGLSKKYKIMHQSEQKASTLREAIPAAAKRLMRRRNTDPDQLLAGSTSEEFWALKGVSFDVKQGEVLGIIGKNGAGKSTLLKILSRITEPTEGAVRIKGRVASLLEVGTGFHPELTGRENVFLNGAILGMSKVEIRSKFDEIVAFAGVEKFLDTPVKRYSSGMYVRLAFAVAAHLEPEILIVDEVLAVGDLDFQKKCLGKMKEVTEGGGRTVLFVSHNVDAIQKLCSRVLVFEKGNIVENAAPDVAIRRYINPEAEVSHTFSIPAPKDDAACTPTSLVVEDLHGNPTNGLPAGSPFQIRVKFTVRRPLEDFVTGIGLVTDRDAPLWTTWAKPRKIDAGRYEVVFRNESIQIYSGLFSIVVGFAAEGKSLSYIPEAGKLMLTDVRGASDALVLNGSSGSILNSMTAEISKVE